MSIVNRVEKIVEYRRKVSEKKKKQCAGYPSVLNWLQPKHPAGNQNTGMSLQDGAKCGNNSRENKTESNQTAGLKLELELDKRTERRRDGLPGLNGIFNHNSSSTKPRSKGGKKVKQCKISTTKGGKRKASDLDIQGQTDNSKRRRCGPIDRYFVINNSAKLGCNDPEVTVKATTSSVPRTVLKVD